MQVSLSFGMYWSVSSFVTGFVIWPDLSRSGWYLVGFVKISQNLVGSRLDLDEISLDLVRSGEISNFQVILRRRTPTITGFCKFSLKNLRISSKVFSFMIRSDGSSFGEETRQSTWRCWVLWVATWHQASERLIQAVGDLGSDWLVGLVRFLDWVDSPTFTYEYIIMFKAWLPQ